jgi:hypothetical protein
MHLSGFRAFEYMRHVYSGNFLKISKIDSFWKSFDVKSSCLLIQIMSLISSSPEGFLVISRFSSLREQRNVWQSTLLLSILSNHQSPSEFKCFKRIFKILNSSTRKIMIDYFFLSIRGYKYEIFFIFLDESFHCGVGNIHILFLTNINLPNISVILIFMCFYDRKSYILENYIQFLLTKKSIFFIFSGKRDTFFEFSNSSVFRMYFCFKKKYS